jgi:hypothetical protein
MPCKVELSRRIFRFPFAMPVSHYVELPGRKAAKVFAARRQDAPIGTARTVIAPIWAVGSSHVTGGTFSVDPGGKAKDNLTVTVRGSDGAQV